jgi:hypothetical protein
MTDCDVTDDELRRAERLALDHLPDGSEARIERGRNGGPHTLYVRSALTFDVEDWGPGALGPTWSCPFYDLITVARWLKWKTEGESVRARDYGHSVEKDGGDAGSIWAIRRAFKSAAGRLSSACHDVGAYATGPGKFNRVPMPLIDANTCRKAGVTPT